jgi:hypothetical protein
MSTDIMRINNNDKVTYGPFCVYYDYSYLIYIVYVHTSYPLYHICITYLSYHIYIVYIQPIHYTTLYFISMMSHLYCVYSTPILYTTSVLPIYDVTSILCI